MIDKVKLQTVLHSPKTRKYGLRFLVAFVLVGVVGFFVLPPLLKSVLLDQLSEALHRPVALKSVSINPYALSVTLECFSVQEPEGGEQFVGFDSLYLNLEAASIFRFAPVLREVRLVNPKIRVVRLSGNRYNFTDLLDEFLAKPENNDPTPSFSLNNIQVTGGNLEFDDRPVSEKHIVSDINLTVPFVSSMAYATESFVEPAFSAHVNGAPMHIKGKSKPFADSLESEIALDLADLQVAQRSKEEAAYAAIAKDEEALAKISATEPRDFYARAFFQQYGGVQGAQRIFQGAVRHAKEAATLVSPFCSKYILGF